MARRKESAEGPPPPDPRREATLDDVVGHEAQRTMLRNTLRAGRLPHALLIQGPDGCGKTTLAYALAREIVADGGDPATHPKALKVARGVHLDLILVVPERESLSGQIKIDQIHDTVEARAWTAPFESPRKIFIISPAHHMNESAANCLLKLLEEPPPSVVFLLICDAPHRLLETIRSRCTPVRLDAVPTATLTPWLIDRLEVDEVQARLLAALAEGCPGRALELGKADMIKRRGEILTELERLLTHGFAGVFGVADRITKGGMHAAEGFTICTTLLRDALMLATRGEGALNTDLVDRLAEFATRYPAGGLLEAAQRFEAAAAEAPYFYALQAKCHFAELVMTDVGRLIKQG